VRSGFVLVKTSTVGARPRTHEIEPSLLRFVLSAVCEQVSADRVILGDGPGLAEPYEEECRRLGYGPIVNELGIKVLDLNFDEPVTFREEWPVSRSFLSADAIINLTRAKTHRRFGVSLAAKSLLGVLSGSILGRPKLAGNHKSVPLLVYQLSQSSPPAFSIIDGNQGIEGEGPLGGSPTNSHFLVSGPGYYSPDVRAAVEMGFDPALVPGFLRPRPTRVEDVSPIRWSEFRVTNTDFLPALSCSWLYRSLYNTKKRERRFGNLTRGFSDCYSSSR
jgi:uncharacterized protein (DUF362 family)